MEPLPVQEEKRRRNRDRRKHFERRGKRDPYYLGEARRFIVARRVRVNDRRTLEKVQIQVN